MQRVSKHRSDYAAEDQGRITLSTGCWNYPSKNFFNDQEQHKLPHFHAVYGEYSGSFTLDGELITGNVPKKQQKLIVAWATIHQEELEALWKSVQETGEYFTIKGLE